MSNPFNLQKSSEKKSVKNINQQPLTNVEDEEVIENLELLLNYDSVVQFELWEEAIFNEDDLENEIQEKN